MYGESGWRSDCLRLYVHIYTQLSPAPLDRRHKVVLQRWRECHHQRRRRARHPRHARGPNWSHLRHEHGAHVVGRERVRVARADNAVVMLERRRIVVRPGSRSTPRAVPVEQAVARAQPAPARCVRAECREDGFHADLRTHQRRPHERQLANLRHHVGGQQQLLLRRREAGGRRLGARADALLGQQLEGHHLARIEIAHHEYLLATVASRAHAAVTAHIFIRVSRRGRPRRPRHPAAPLRQVQ
ncbi:hypothetical protein T492DRAFT_191084, partial [Pavlovales sp. CCMP2436]